MKIEKIIKRPCFGGGFSIASEITTDEHKGQSLGSAIRGDEIIVEASTEHIESEDEGTMAFDFGTIRKDRIKALVWHSDEFSTQVCRVQFAA
jgi:hypothetical protein